MQQGQHGKILFEQMEIMKGFLVFLLMYQPVIFQNVNSVASYLPTD